MKGSFLKGAIVGFVCAALGGATVALAGSGINGVFNLGVSNSVDAKTTLTGASPGIQLQVTNTSAAAGTSGLAVNSASGATTGVFTNSGGGPAGGFFVNAGVKPFTVNSQAKVGNLNADLLDGLDSPALQKRVTGTCAAGSAVRVVNDSGTVSCQAVGTGGGGWSLAGNAGTSPGANFLGTTDAHALVVKTNGNEALRVTSSGNVGIGTASPLTRFEVDSQVRGILGVHTAATGIDPGVGGASASTDSDAVGVLGQVTAAGATGTGVLGKVTAPGATGNGVQGIGGLNGGSFFTALEGGTGVVGQANNGSSAYGLWGISSSGYAGVFSGKVLITGDLNVVGTKNFRIDDPLDPANKYLVHAALESNEALDVYSGNVTTDGSGLATVQLPEWFERINTDFRYQLTIVGTRGWNARISEEIEDNQFTIQTDQPDVQVSWQVTAQRNDPYMRAHPFQAEQTKTGLEQGKYVTPQAYGQPASASIEKRPPVPQPPAAPSTP
jgi:hypothetical protein